MRRFVLLSNFADTDNPVPRPSRRRNKHQSTVTSENITRYFKGGKYRPLNDTDCDRIIETAFGILEKTGIADTPDWLSHELLAKGRGLTRTGVSPWVRAMYTSAPVVQPCRCWRQARVFIRTQRSVICIR